MSLAIVKNSLSCFHKEMLKIGSSKLKKKKALKLICMVFREVHLADTTEKIPYNSWHRVAHPEN